jgi:hypothetical protein
VKAEFGPEVEKVCVGLVGVQSRDDTARLPDRALFDEDNGPIQVECARYVDASGCTNRFWIAYWLDVDKFGAWRHDSAMRRWLSAPERLTENAGCWFETFSIARDDFETIFGTSNPSGVSCAGARMTENDRTHGYWGSMRDRIPNSLTDSFVSPMGNRLKRAAPRETFGKRWRIKAPKNLCYIRSGQDYSHCGAEQRKTYVEEIAPVLKDGMDYLRDNPEETGCCLLRFAELVGSGSAATEQTFGLGYFLSLGNLEDWSSTHRTHLVIFSKWQQMYRKYDFNIELRTWHEVGILRGQTEFEYVNCHPETGILPYFEGEEIMPQVDSVAP